MIGILVVIPKFLVKQKLIEMLLKNKNYANTSLDKKLNTISHLLFHEDINIENHAKNEMLSYI